MAVTSLDEKIQSRSTILRRALEEEITKAVKADEACEGFSGVIAEPTSERTDRGANWRIKGIKFGTADRSKAASIVATVAEQMQLIYELSGDHHSD
jgi:hypothetical protein